MSESELPPAPKDDDLNATVIEVMIMQWVASHKYRLISGDIKTAFLRGDGISETFSFHHLMA